MPALPSLFNHDSTDTTLVPWTLNGQPGWFKVPTEWAVRTNADGSVTASPNSDFTEPTYEVKTAIDGTMVVQNLWQSRLDGRS